MISKFSTLLLIMGRAEVSDSGKLWESSCLLCVFQYMSPNWVCVCSCFWNEIEDVIVQFANDDFSITCGHCCFYESIYGMEDTRKTYRQ